MPVSGPLFRSRLWDYLRDGTILTIKLKHTIKDSSYVGRVISIDTMIDNFEMILTDGTLELPVGSIISVGFEELDSIS